MRVTYKWYILGYNKLVEPPVFTDEDGDTYKLTEYDSEYEAALFGTNRSHY